MEKIKELGFKNVGIVSGNNDNERFLKHYNDNLQIHCQLWFNDVSLHFLTAEGRQFMLATSVAYEFALFLIKKIENGFNNN